MGSIIFIVIAALVILMLIGANGNKHEDAMRKQLVEKLHPGLKLESRFVNFTDMGYILSKSTQAIEDEVTMVVKNSKPYQKAIADHAKARKGFEELMAQKKTYLPDALYTQQYTDELAAFNKTNPDPIGVIRANERGKIMERVELKQSNDKLDNIVAKEGKV